jgi:CDP-diacylglycerol---serine O-phosphatidyltransferase
MKNFKYVFPNALTILNLLLGSVAIVVVFRGQNEYNAAWLIFLAAFFDMLDGMVARALDARSEFGVQLDSLADVVSFGIAPSIILFNWFTIVLTELSENSNFEIVSANLWQSVLLICPLLFGAAAALRLARFNISEKSPKVFNGLPTPAAAMIVASLWLILGFSESDLVHRILINIYVVLGVLVILMYLMLSNLKMLSLKFSGMGFTHNFLPYLLIIIGVVLIVLFWIYGIFLTMLAYLVLSVVINFTKRPE